MKKRAKQLAMLGLTVTMMCGTQITAFAADAEEVAPVAIETEVKAEPVEIKVEANEEEKADVKEDIVTGTEVAEEEAETDVPAEETEAETDADKEAVPTPAPQADVNANADTNTEAEVETEAEDKEVTAPTVSATVNTPVFDGTQDLVVTVKVEHDGECQISMDAFIPINGTAVPAKDMKHSATEISITYGKEAVLDLVGKLNLKDGDTLTIGTSKCWVEYDYANGKEPKVVGFPDVYVTYSTGDTDNGGDNGNNGGGTVTPEPEKDGWIKTEEGWKYYENGQKATGWKAVSENWYYFNEDGIMATGWVSVGGHWYYLNTDGSMATGWASVGGHWYYLNADGTMATGWVSVGGHWYYLNTDGTMVTGWVSVGGHWYYLNEDGTMASNQWIDGWYVDASGKML